jgi:peptide deformylase
MFSTRNKILDVVRMGHPVLRKIAALVESQILHTPEFREFCAKLTETMFATQGVGLAAPQVGQSMRCFAYYLPNDEEDDDNEFGDEIGVKILINPQIHPLGDTKESDWEGCLSIPGIRGLVPRYTSIRVEALDVEGNHLQFQADDFHARVIQHEFDHLDGILFIDRMESLQSLSFEKELREHT